MLPYILASSPHGTYLHNSCPSKPNHPLAPFFLFLFLFPEDLEDGVPESRWARLNFRRILNRVHVSHYLEADQQCRHRLTL